MTTSSASNSKLKERATALRAALAERFHLLEELDHLGGDRKIEVLQCSRGAFKLREDVVGLGDVGFDLSDKLVRLVHGVLLGLPPVSASMGVELRRKKRHFELS